METTRDERRKWIQWTLDNGDWRLKDLDTDFLRRVIRDANKADRLAAIERQVLWRTEDMPADARYWRKFGVELAQPQCAYKDMFSRELCAAPDYRPDEEGPLFLPILDPEAK